MRTNTEAIVTITKPPNIAPENPVPYVVGVSPDGKTVSVISANLTAIVLDLPTGTVRTKHQSDEANATALCLLQDAATFASGLGGELTLWDVRTVAPKKRIQGNHKQTWCLAVSPDGKSLAAACGPSEVKLFNLETSREFASLKAAHLSLAISPHGLLATGAADGNVRFWDMATSRLLKGPLLAEDGDLKHVDVVAFSPDGNMLASGGRSGTIKVWSTESAKLVHTFPPEFGSVLSLAFSPDSKKLAAGNFSEEIHLWNLETGKRVKLLTGHVSPVSTVAFAPDGRTLVSGSWDGTVKLWDISTGRTLWTNKLKLR
jgi:WD40 repeat protein